MRGVALNNFNEFYPNVTVSYEQTGGSMLGEYIQNNPHTDVFMSADENVRGEKGDPDVLEYCADLSKEDIDFSAFKDDILDSCYADGKLVRIPISEYISGIVVNKTLLEKEGLTVPETYSEFLSVLAALKEKGYTTIQGAEIHVYSCLVYNMAMSEIGSDANLIENGYTSHDINSTYPDDNCDGAILTFFEGNVPFRVCDYESVSGMKKRESKSEAFTANPFEYEFMSAHVGENGAYNTMSRGTASP